MTERKKIKLPTGSAPSTDGPRRRPVRPGTAPRTRVFSEVQAERAERKARQDAWQERDERGPRGERPGDRRDDRRQDSRDGHRDGRPGMRRDERGGAPHARGDGQPARQEGRRDDRRQDSRDGYRDGPRDAPREGYRGERRDGPRNDRRDERRPEGREGYRGERRDDGRNDQRTDRPAHQPRERQNPKPWERRDDGDRGYRSDRPPRTERPDRALREDTPRAAVPTVRQAPEDGRVRLSKVMSEKGLASRREADDWIVNGWVRVDGEVVTELGTRIFPDQRIDIDAQARAEQSRQVTILLHKPIGYVSGQAEDGHEPAVVLIHPDNHWAEDPMPWKLQRGHLHKLAPAGRLDIDSTGLLVLTQDGRIARQLIGEDALVEKEYLVRVVWQGAPEAENVMEATPPEVLEQLQYGLSLDGKPLKPAKVSWQNEHQLRFVLREGKKRQIRRMCELVGLKVVGLKRVRMGRVVLGKLPMGQWRFLRPDEQF
jgi:23S rRNA pseudouridine2604 synthase